MLNLPWRKITLIFALAFITVSMNAQIRGTYNYLDFANKPYYFGITLSYNSSNYRIIQGQEFILSDSISSITSPRGPGFNLGIVTNLKIGKFFDFRLLPTLSFSDRRLEYRRTGTGQIETKKIEAVFIEAPFLIRYKSAPYKDIRLFVIAGVKYSYDVASNSRTRQASSLVKVSPSDFAVEYGFGIQFFFPYFIFSPEIKVSQGLSNILISDKDLIYSSVIDRILSRTLTISFHFEG